MSNHRNILIIFNIYCSENIKIASDYERFYLYQGLMDKKEDKNGCNASDFVTY